MRDVELPMGRVEGPELEFKDAEVLGDLFGLSRSIVGLLNAKGGVIWVGIEEHGERAVNAHPVPDPELSVRRIEDHLADAVEPALVREVSIESVELKDGGELLRIGVEPDGSRAPYAVVKRGARQFLIRVGARLRPMSRAEIREAFAGSPEVADPASQAGERLFAERSEVQERGFSGLLLLIVPVGEISLPVPSRQLSEYFRDPTRTGNRPLGWNFANPYVEARPALDSMVLGDEEVPQTTVAKDGRIRFTVPGEHLHWEGAERDIWPYCLCEYPISVLRLARTLYSEHCDAGLQAVRADLSLLRLGGWRLRPYSPNAIGYRLAEGVTLDEEDLLPPSPLRFGRDEMLEEPDRCAYRLLLRIYAGFQYLEEDMPREFDNEGNRFIMRK